MTRLEQLRIKIAMEFDTEKELQTYLKEHPGADRANHSVKKDSESSKTDPAFDNLRGHLKDELTKMPDKFLDSNAGYKHPAVKALAKELEKAPKAQVQKQYEQVDNLKIQLGRKYDPRNPDPDSEKRRAKVDSLWRAYKLALENMGTTESQHKEPGFSGKYLSRAEFRKYKEIKPNVANRLKEWQGSSASDPVRKVLVDHQKNGWQVKRDLIDKAIKHLEELAEQPRHKDERGEIGTLIKDLGGTFTMDKAARLKELRAMLSH